MNTPIRKLGYVVGAMFVALLVAASYIQVFQAPSLNAHPGNTRVINDGYKRQRGSILVDGQAIASSSKSDDQYVYQRTYANGPLYAPITGYSSLVYGNGDGVEGASDDYLSGTSDKLFYHRLYDIITGKQTQGANLQLTVDPTVQAAAVKALGNRKGAVVALDPKTGAVLAMASSPSYDPNRLASHNSRSVTQAWNSMVNASNQPMVNRAIAGNLYPPGSTFKLVTTAAALESGDYTAGSQLPGPASMRLPLTNRSLPNDNHLACGPGGMTTLSHALTISCNTAYAKLGMNLGAESLSKMSTKFGFGDVFRVPMRVTPSTFPTDLNTPQLAMSAIGQYDVRVTPLEVAMISATIANGGKQMQPYLVKDVVDSNLNVLSSTDPKVWGRPITAKTASTLTSMMTSVVSDSDGTGKLAALSGIDVAGKTGTAQGAEGAASSLWFTGFAPAKNPKVALAIVLEDGGGQGTDTLAGEVAAPAAKQIFEAALK